MRNVPRLEKCFALASCRLTLWGYELPIWWGRGERGKEEGLQTPQASREQQLSKVPQAHKTQKNITHCMWRKQQCELLVNSTFYISIHNAPTPSYPWHSDALTIWTLGNLTVLRFIVKSVVIGWHSSLWLNSSCLVPKYLNISRPSCFYLLKWNFQK